MFYYHPDNDGTSVPTITTADASSTEAELFGDSEPEDDDGSWLADEDEEPGDADEATEEPNEPAEPEPIPAEEPDVLGAEANKLIRKARGVDHKQLRAEMERIAQEAEQRGAAKAKSELDRQIAALKLQTSAGKQAASVEDLSADAIEAKRKAVLEKINAGQLDNLDEFIDVLGTPKAQQEQRPNVDAALQAATADIKLKYDKTFAGFDKLPPSAEFDHMVTLVRGGFNPVDAYVSAYKDKLFAQQHTRSADGSHLKGGAGQRGAERAQASQSVVNTLLKHVDGTKRKAYEETDKELAHLFSQ